LKSDQGGIESFNDLNIRNYISTMLKSDQGGIEKISKSC